MKFNLKYLIAGLVCAVIIAGIGVSSYISAMSVNEIRGLKGMIEEAKEEANAPEDPEYVKIGEVYEIKPTKNISDAYISGDESALTDDEKKTLQLASEVIKEVVKDDMSLYEKEKALYDWVTKNISNEYEGMGANPQQLAEPGSVLVTKTAVCVGFATTYKLLVNMIGIDCMVEHDFEKSHSWDVLKLDDGCWYICDCYMGVSARMANFNLNQEYALANHSFDVSQYPVANGMKYFPAFNEKKDIYKPEDVIKLMAEFIEGKSDFMSIGLKKTSTSNAALEYLISGISSRVELKNAYLDYSVSNVKIDGVEYTLALISKSTMNEGYEEIPEETIEKYDRLLDHQFGEMEGGDDGDSGDDDETDYTEAMG
ncbi:MAG: hypothetical protein J5715_09110 [Clostridiales bacterium]|nr:hypothetical protein [Clostridiales bacterium]